MLNIPQAVTLPPSTLPTALPMSTPGRPGRKAVISRDDLVNAALALLGPTRSFSSLSLREVAREADIAPNSFYRQFRDMDELGVALVELAGRSLTTIILEARHRVSPHMSVVRSSVGAFMEQLFAGDKLLLLLLREGAVGSPPIKRAIERQLSFFEEELRQDLLRLAQLKQTALFEPAMTARAITRLVFTMGSQALDAPKEDQSRLTEELATMVRLIVTGTQALGENPDA
jgi:TetR/AcrR family transcriptional regulator, fatty acid biosynthesis regulator